MSLLGDSLTVHQGWGGQHYDNVNQQEDKCNSRETQLPKCRGALCPGYLVRWQRIEDCLLGLGEEAKTPMPGLPTGHSLHPFLLLGVPTSQWGTALKSFRLRPAFTFSSTMKTVEGATFPDSSTLSPCLPSQPAHVKGKIPGNKYVP